jgi:hypothetical protein
MQLTETSMGRPLDEMMMGHLWVCSLRASITAARTTATTLASASPLVLS